MADALPMHGRMIHPVQGAVDFGPTRSMAPGRSTELAAASTPCPARRGRGRAVGSGSYSKSTRRPRSGEWAVMNVETPSGKALFDADVVIGADGAGSAVRGQLLGAGAIDERLDFLDYGYKELHIPPQHGEFALDPAALPHLAARLIDDDRVTQSRSFVHVHAVLAQRWSGCFAALSTRRRSIGTSGGNIRTSCPSLRRSSTTTSTTPSDCSGPSSFPAARGRAGRPAR